MKAVNIQWDTEDCFSTPLSNEMNIPDEVLKIDKAGKDTSAVYNERVEAISDYITEKTGYCHKGFNIETERKDAVQWCLDEGHGIEYDPNKGETTQAELDSSGDNTRYVMKDAVDYFTSDDAYVKGSTQYAIISEMCLLDFDEWNAIAEATGVQLSWNDAIAINGMLWENYDFSPLECPENTGEAKTVKDAVLEDLVPEDEKAIYDILSKYNDNKLELSTDKEITK